ncbi:CaM kinase-like vesicle-associated protein [Oryzias melastigma]|uniref:CaM kinase-like vesicle-associated protein n=1 Tax=Oryzias melastigma TaxID=30732 RepID=A0A834F3D8_ORYME|nr:CaM kinase-like vesicle-associated protein [Oryzias melastigma]
MVERKRMRCICLKKKRVQIRHKIDYLNSNTPWTVFLISRNAVNCLFCFCLKKKTQRSCLLMRPCSLRSVFSVCFRVNHPNILQLIDTFETRKEYFIVQELATGGDVFDWILDQGNYTERDASNVIRQVLEAVAYLHSLNIVHRNLKLENLMYYTENNHNKVVLRDFYLSRFENGPITEPCGTPEYLAPEVVARHRYGRPVDCWAVGVIMFILIAGNGASEKNLKDGVCAQFEKNFAKAKWRKAIRVTTFMQRLKNSEALTDSSAGVESSAEAGEGEGGISQGTSDDGEKLTSDGGVTSSSVSLEVTVENTSTAMSQDEGAMTGKEKHETVNMPVGPSVGTSPSDVQDPIIQTCSIPKTVQVEPNKAGVKKVAGDGTRKIAANFGQNKVVPEVKQTSTVSSDPQKQGINLELKHASALPDPSSKCKMATKVHGTQPTGAAATSSSPERRPATQSVQKDESDGSWCQTQVPEAVAERSVVATSAPGVDTGLGVRLRGDVSPASRRDRDAKRADRYSAEFSVARTGAVPGQGCYAAGSSASLGRHATPYNPESVGVGLGMAGSFPSPYTHLYTSGGGVGMYGTGLHHGSGVSSATSDWQMDSVIEQIEKQMAAVLEKIEGDMPSLLEQISDCPAESLCTRSTHASPSTSRTHSAQRSSASASTTPPPLPTSPRPALPSLPHLAIPPPSYPPPSPPTQDSPQAGGESEEGEGQKSVTQTSQSPRAGFGRGL